MKNILYLIILFIFTSCSTGKDTYWCGDHPCINKKEKEAYFRKTMVVEIKNLEKKTSKNNSEIGKIIQQARKGEKKRIKEEKKLAKQALKEEKKLSKKKSKKLNKKKSEKQIVASVAGSKIEISEFKTWLERITKKNSFRPFPDINDIPN